MAELNKKLILALLCLTFLINLTGADETGIVVQSIERNIDLRTGASRVSVVYQFRNEGETPVDSVLIAVPQHVVSRMAFFVVTSGPIKQIDDLSDESTLPISLENSARKDIELYRVKLSQPVAPGGIAALQSYQVFVNAIVPFPAKIKQSELQFTKYSGDSAHVLSPYKVLTQRTTISLPSQNIISKTDVSPVVAQGESVTYGPYNDILPFTQTPIDIHFENSQAILFLEHLRTEFEVSHWGDNLAVEDTYTNLKHVGAEFDGPFSRYDYVRNPQGAVLAAAKGLRTVLPSGAADIYYRDVIGNISTSSAFAKDDGVELEIRPRYPLMGGWQITFYMGYNLPLYSYLSQSEDGLYVLKGKFGTPFGQVPIKNQEVRVILPEGAKDITVHSPFDLDETPSFEKHFTYLDIVGRPVVVLRKSNVVAEHRQDFAVMYRFSSIAMLTEPFLLFAAFMTMFLIAMIYFRLDLSLVPLAKAKTE